MRGLAIFGPMILVTGATGLLGAHLLLDLLKTGERVRAVMRSEARKEGVKRVFSYYLSPRETLEYFNRIDWVEADLLEPGAAEDVMEGISVVYNCAALISFSPKDKDRVVRDNAELTANVVNACLFRGVKRLCHVSSIAALGRTEEKREPVKEDTPWKNSPENSKYAVSKYDSEREVWRGMEEGLSAFIVNPGIILGPGYWNSGSGRLIGQAAKGLPYYTLGENGFVDVRDVSAAMLQLMEAGVEHERFILVGDHLSYRDLFFTLADCLGKKRPWLHARPWMTNVVWRLEKIRGWFGADPLITRETARSARGRYRYSNEKILKTLPNFHFRSMKRTLEETVSCYISDFPSSG